MANFLDINTYEYQYDKVYDIQYLTVTLYRGGKKIAVTTKASTDNDRADRLEAVNALLGSANPNKLPVIMYN